jgi:hypothetical protein
VSRASITYTFNDDHVLGAPPEPSTGSTCLRDQMHNFSEGIVGVVLYVLLRKVMKSKFEILVFALGR